LCRQAQAEREKQARIILGSAEAGVADRFVEAAKTYAEHPTALQLRAMNIIYETTKERGSTILIPTAMVDTMNPASGLVLAGLAAADRESRFPSNELDGTPSGAASLIASTRQNGAGANEIG
jgi:hypothetical protein